MAGIKQLRELNERISQFCEGCPPRPIAFAYGLRLALHLDEDARNNIVYSTLADGLDLCAPEYDDIGTDPYDLVEGVRVLMCQPYDATIEDLIDAMEIYIKQLEFNETNVTYW